MEKSVKSKLVNEIESQLDNFFGDEPKQEAAMAPQISLEKLKSAVLSIDWEITDACLSDLITETEALLPSFEDDLITHALLRMLRALGRYIRKRKAQSHQDAIKRVMSVFASLETLINDKQIDGLQKKNIVAKEIQAFKKLKEQVEAQRFIASDRNPHSAQSRELAEAASVLDNQNFKQVMHAVEEKIHAEVKVLKDQLQSLQKELDTIRKK